MGSSREKAASKHPREGWSTPLQLEVERDDHRGYIRTIGYINRQAGQQIGELAQRLAAQGVEQIKVDLGGSPLVNVPALETLLKTRQLLLESGVSLSFAGAVPAVEKALRLMEVSEEANRARQ